MKKTTLFIIAVACLLILLNWDLIEYHPTRPPPARPSVTYKQVEGDPAYPHKLITVLGTDMTFGGVRCGLRLSGEGWHKSKFDGTWNAILMRSFGPNEVSCLLESQDPSTVQRIELEAEFYQPGYMESEILLQFAQSAQVLMHPGEPPRKFAEAVANMSEWSNDQWKLTRTPYTNGGFGLMLKRTAE